KEKVMEEEKRFFRPEFLNRIDGTVVFHALTKEHILSIVDLMIKKVQDQLTEKSVTLEITTEAKERLADKGYDPNFGARPLRRVIQDEIEDMLSEDLLSGNLHPGDTVVIDVEADRFVARSRVALPSG
ncbi:MAG: ATP-dependent Clp protease ATP-binding subunit, partial [Chloroflexi bacterium]|nr:ATP-dependent Clp protease ATP-binding subunit [Chloroflexota bacterium]